MAPAVWTVASGATAGGSTERTCPPPPPSLQIPLPIYLNIHTSHYSHFSLSTHLSSSSQYPLLTYHTNTSRPTHHLASSLHHPTSLPPPMVHFTQTHMPSHTNHALHHIHVLLPPSLKPYTFTPCISTWPACSNAHNILLTNHCHSPHISQGYTSLTRHCTGL